MFTGTEFVSPCLRVSAATWYARYTVSRIVPFWHWATAKCGIPLHHDPQTAKVPVISSSGRPQPP